MKPTLEALESRDCPAAPPIAAGNPWYTQQLAAWQEGWGWSIVSAVRQGQAVPADEIAALSPAQTAALAPPVSSGGGWITQNAFFAAAPLDGPLARNYITTPSHAAELTGPTPGTAQAIVDNHAPVTITTQADQLAPDASSAMLGFLPPVGQSLLNTTTGQVNDGPGSQWVVSWSVGGTWYWSASAVGGDGTWSAPVQITQASLHTAALTTPATGSTALDLANVGLAAALLDVAALQQ